MHMSDALLAPAVAATMYVMSTSTAGVSVIKLRAEERSSDGPASVKLPTMAVMSALVFAGQMVNYTIPGTGSSGHLCGSMLLTSLLGPWAGFLSMIAVLLIQCLFFADGGILALGANVWNMAFYGCFVGYFLIYRPILRSRLFAKKGVNTSNRIKLVLAAVLGCIAALQLGAFSVVIETSLSGITELPFGAFAGMMQPIHLAIGLVEGLITSAVLLFVYEARPELLQDLKEGEQMENKVSYKATISILAIVTVVVGGGLSLAASTDPDGLEWALFGNTEGGYSQNMGLDEEAYGVHDELHDRAAAVRENTAFMPDYSFADEEENPSGTGVAGLVGSVMVAVLAVAICLAGGFLRRGGHHKKKPQ